MNLRDTTVRPLAIQKWCIPAGASRWKCSSLEVLIKSKGWNARTFLSAEEFLAHPEVGVPSCLLLEATHRDVDWLQVQRRVAARRSRTSIIFLSTYVDLPMAVQAIKAGAREFFTTPFGNDALVAAMEDAVEQSRLHSNNQRR